MNVKKLIYGILFCLSAGVIGSIFTTSSISNWYATLNKAAFNPPNYLFGPVWTILYTLMGITLYLIWTEKRNIWAERLFYLQLALNISWSIIFFGLRNPFFAFINIIVLWVAIVTTIYYARKTTKLGAYLMIPYLIWVTFASILNFSIVILN